jgi:hypothetical protein
MLTLSDLIILTFGDELIEGWITMNGAKVHVGDDGTVDRGPPHLVGNKHVSSEEISARKAAAEKQKESKLKNEHPVAGPIDFSSVSNGEWRSGEEWVKGYKKGGFQQKGKLLKEKEDKGTVFSGKQFKNSTEAWSARDEFIDQLQQDGWTVKSNAGSKDSGKQVTHLTRETSALRVNPDGSREENPSVHNPVEHNIRVTARGVVSSQYAKPAFTGIEAWETKSPTPVVEKPKQEWPIRYREVPSHTRQTPDTVKSRLKASGEIGPKADPDAFVEPTTYASDADPLWRPGTSVRGSYGDGDPNLPVGRKNFRPPRSKR